jgi:hypothetical protein
MPSERRKTARLRLLKFYSSGAVPALMKERCANQDAESDEDEQSHNKKKITDHQTGYCETAVTVITAPVQPPQTDMGKDYTNKRAEKPGHEEPENRHKQRDQRQTIEIVFLFAGIGIIPVLLEIGSFTTRFSCPAADWRTTL